MNRHNKIESDARVGIFVDVQNMFYSARNLFNMKIDYGALIDALAAQRNVVVANAYVLFKKGVDFSSFETALRMNGFDVKKREEELNASINPMSAISNWDVGISLDIMEWANKLDTIIIVSGSSAYADVLQRIRHKTRIEIVGFEKNTSRLTREFATDFVDISLGGRLNVLQEGKFEQKQGPVLTGVGAHTEDESVGNRK